MKKLSAIIIAMALVLGMSQCKKQETPATPTNNDGMVYITVNVGDNGGKHTVYPNHGLYGFDNGDILYVGNNGHFVGTLEYQDGAFTGGIQSPSTSDYLHFYFLGGKTPATAPTAGTTTDFTISIADQSSNLPLLAYGRSAQKYNGPDDPYSTTLRNKCALVKFELLAGTTDAVTVANMLTEATINFGNTENAIVPTATKGTITLYPESEKAKWAILLPQNTPIGGFSVNIGTDPFSVTGSYTISNNGFINSGIVIDNRVNLTYLTGDYNAQDGDVLTGSTIYKVTIPSGATVTLNDVNINGGGIMCSGNATIVLENSNSVEATAPNYPGIHIAYGFTLTIQGDGALNAIGGENGAGIGAGCWPGYWQQGADRCGNIVIKSGTINAYGSGYGSAGIGGAKEADCGNISIEGGVIHAYGVDGGAGIGGGGGNNGISRCGAITISGGDVTAESQMGGAGIGEGYRGMCGTITIGYGITKVQASALDPWGYGMIGACIGMSYGSSNIVIVDVDGRLSDTESDQTRIIQH